jgi:hypothetical protein
MRSSLSRLAISFVAAAACGSSDDPDFTDGGGGPGFDASSQAACSMTPYGSCRSNDGFACAEYAGSISQQQAMAQCGNFGETTWSSSPCDRTDTVGGCQIGQASPLGAYCTTLWWYPPTTAEAGMAACGTAGTWIPGEGA